MLWDAVKLLARMDQEVATTLYDAVYVYCPEEAGRYERMV
jgi:hypothetical protein